MVIVFPPAAPSPKHNLNATSLMKPCLIPLGRYEHHLPRASKIPLGVLAHDESQFAWLKLCVPVFSSLVNYELTSLTPTRRQNSFVIYFCIPLALKRVTFSQKLLSKRLMNTFIICPKLWQMIYSPSDSLLWAM